MQKQKQSTDILIPTLRWAQKNEKVFITIVLRDICNQSIQLNPTSIAFSGTSCTKLYKFALQLYQPISVSQSRTFKTGAYFLFELVKEKDGRKIKWPRLNKENKRLSYVLIDWDRWDQQSQEEEEIKSGKFESSGEQDDKQFGIRQAKANDAWNDDNDDDQPPQNYNQQNSYPDNDDAYQSQQKQQNYPMDDNDDYNEDLGNDDRYNDQVDDAYDDKYDRDEGRRDDDD